MSSAAPRPPPGYRAGHRRTSTRPVSVHVVRNLWYLHVSSHILTCCPDIYLVAVDHRSSHTCTNRNTGEEPPVLWCFLLHLPQLNSGDYGPVWYLNSKVAEKVEFCGKSRGQQFHPESTRHQQHQEQIRTPTEPAAHFISSKVVFCLTAPVGFQRVL